MPRAEAKYRITAQDKTRDGLRNAESKLVRFKRRIGRLLGGGIATLARPVAAIGVGLTAWATSLGRSARELDDIAKRAADLSTTAADIVELDLGASLTGSTPEKAARALERFDRALRDAAEGNKEIVELFDLLGTPASEFAAVDDVTDRLALLGDALATVADERTRSALRQELAGRGLGRLFENGGAGIREGAAEAQRLGLTQGLVRQTEEAERLLDEWAKFKAVLNDRFRDVPGRESAADALAGATEFLASIDESNRGSPLRAPPPPGIPGVTTPVDGPKESTQRQQLATLRHIDRLLLQGARATPAARYGR